MSSLPRTVLVPSGPLRFSGTVPARRALVYDAREGRWRLRREDVYRPAVAAASFPAAQAPGGGPPEAPRVRQDARHSRGKALALGALGVVAGLAAGALVDRFGPVMGAVGSGSLPVGARRTHGADLAAASAAWVAPSPPAPEHDMAPAAPVAMDAPGAASLPVPAFVLARAHREAALPALPAASRVPGARPRPPARRSHESEPRASDEPILNVPVSADPAPARARIDRGGLDRQ